jgi:hypothetical protein
VGSAHRHELLPGALDEEKLGAQAGRLGRRGRLVQRLLGGGELAGFVAICGLLEPSAGPDTSPSLTAGVASKADRFGTSR